MNVTAEISSIDEATLAALKRGGNDARAAVARVFTQFQPRTVAYLRRRGADAETADDICQDLFVRMMEKIHDYRGDSHFEAWLFSILRNLWIDRHRSVVQQVSLPEDEGDSFSVPEEFRAEDRSVDRISVKRALSALEAFATADPAAAHLIELRVIEGWDYDQLAVYYETTPAAVRERVSYVRRKLEKYFGPLLDFLRNG
jgi:RNA polymerase sigma-70 factor (ECF subfamily)